MVGPTELGVFMVKGKEVGGLIIVVAVARGTFPVNGEAFVGGFEVNTVTLLFITGMKKEKNIKYFWKNLEVSNSK